MKKQFSVLLCKSLPYVGFVIVSMLLINNLFYGYGWTDESFYIASVNRLFNGEKLFIDDWSPTQAYIPLLYPIYALYVKLNGNADGVILFFRIFTVCFLTLVAFITYFVFSKKYGATSSFFAAALIIVFARARIPGASYYTLALATCVLGVVLLYDVFVNNGPQFFLLISGVFFAFAVLCNPYLVIPYVILSILSLIIRSARFCWKKFLLCWLGTVFTAIIYVALFLPLDDLGTFLFSLKYIFNDPAYGRSSILFVKSFLKCPRLLIFPYVFTYLPVAIFIVIIRVRKIAISNRIRLIFFFLNTLFLLVNSICVKRSVESPIMSLFLYVILTVVFFRGKNLSRCFRIYKEQLLFSIMPGLILSYFFCLASDTGFGVCAIGVVLSSFGLFSILQDCYGSKKCLIIPATIVVVCALLFRVNLPYRDSPLKPHFLFVPNANSSISQINNGSAKGLYTTNKNLEQYNLVYNSIKSLSYQCGDGLLVSQLVPWVYIELPGIKCAAPTTWRIFLDDYRLQPYFTEFADHKFPKFVFIFDKTLRDNNREHDDSKDDNSWIMEQLKTKNYRVKRTPCGVLFSSVDE